ncbi:hypothetical protein [Acuticoccus sediminis]|nr:hypothetical protein [Acuticoccus sediminis]
MDLFWLRMVMWVRRRPSRQFMIAAVAVIVLAAVLVTIEKLGWWPDWAHADRVGRRGPGIHATPMN